MEGEYLTLSYCCGPLQDYSLTTDNPQSCLQGLDTPMVSQTIRDTMEVAKNLGFTYLWVDALCIIQDSNQSKTPKFGNCL
jgi:hypothetical protein